MTLIDYTINKPSLTIEQFTYLGDGEVAYVRKIPGGKLQEMFPQVKEQNYYINNKKYIYVLLGADGVPIIISNSQDTITSSARELKLEMVYVN